MCTHHVHTQGHLEKDFPPLNLTPDATVPTPERVSNMRKVSSGGGGVKALETHKAFEKLLNRADSELVCAIVYKMIVYTGMCHCLHNDASSIYNYTGVSCCFHNELV